MRSSVALATETAELLGGHLLAAAPEEDVCFALYRPSRGLERRSGLVYDLVLPEPDERRIHGNASFTDRYFLRAAGLAADTDSGLALVHTHPAGRGWQGMSRDDVEAERGHAAQALVLTELPLLGLTLAGDGSLSARFWDRRSGDEYRRRSCESVRVVGEQMKLTYDEQRKPAPPSGDALTRTISAWGEAMQADLARLQIGIVGAGSVGALVAECLARTGIEHIVLIDFDVVKPHNLDRLLFASARDALLRRPKVDVLREGLLRSATAARPRIDALPLSLVEPDGLAAALDCDVLFSCVDRPWPRLVLNQIAYAHLIPVIDGGIRVDAGAGLGMQGAEWGARVVAPGRRCLECAGRFDAGYVQAERDGLLEDVHYLQNLPPDHPLKANENVFAFSLGAASLEVNQLLSMLVAPSGLADNGGQTYHFHLGTLDRDLDDCDDGCYYSNELAALGDGATMLVGEHQAAELARQAAAADRRSGRARLARTADRIVRKIREAEHRLSARLH